MEFARYIEARRRVEERRRRSAWAALSNGFEFIAVEYDPERSPSREQTERGRPYR